MATSRDDVQDATGRRTFISGVGEVAGVGGGAMGGFPMNTIDANSSGVPQNGKAGFLPGAQYQNFKGTAGSVFYINVGTVASSTWVELTGGGGLTDITMPANTANAFYVWDGTTKYLDFDTRTTVTGVKAVAIQGSAPTIVSATGDTYSQAYVGTITVTLTGTTTVTALDGIGLYIDTPTVTDASAGTVTTVSNLYVAAPAAAGGSLTITNSYAVHSAGAVLIDTTLTVTGNATISGGTITVSAAATTLTVKAATAATFVVSDGVISAASLDTRTTTTGAGGWTFQGENITLAAAASVFTSPTIKVAAKTVTATGSAASVTSWYGNALYIDTQTWTDSSAGTITAVSAIYIAANAAAGGSLTITNSYSIFQSSGANLSNAGTFNNASSHMHKEEIAHAQAKDIFDLLDQFKPRSYKWKKSHCNDRDRRRIGLIAEEVPECLHPVGLTHVEGEPASISIGDIAAFALAAVKALKAEVDDLKLQLAKK